MGQSLLSSAGVFMLSSTRGLCFILTMHFNSGPKFPFWFESIFSWCDLLKHVQQRVSCACELVWGGDLVTCSRHLCAVLFCLGGKKTNIFFFSHLSARLSACCRVYAASFYRTMMSLYYKLPFAKGQTVLDVKIGDSEVISHQRKCLSAADSRLFCLSPVWWGGVPCCISGIVTCWPVCRHQVTLPSDFSPVRRWTLDFRNVSASFHHVVVPLPHCSASDNVLMLQLYMFMCVFTLGSKKVKLALSSRAESKKILLVILKSEIKSSFRSICDLELRL